jgi:hypothetical protein
VGTREGFTRLELPATLSGGYSLVLRGEDDALLLGKVAYRWDGRGLAQPEPELDELIRETRLDHVASAPGTDVLFAQSRGDFVRVERGKVVDRAEAFSAGVARFAGAGGSFFAQSPAGIVSFENGAFRFAPLHMPEGIADIAGDERNLWVLGSRGTILRKRLTAP